MKIGRMLLTAPMFHTRLIIAMSSLTWAFLLGMPGETFGPARKTYLIMSMMAPEVIWAIFFMVHGVVALLALMSGVRNWFTLTFDGFLGAILWTSSTAACFAVYWDTSLPWMTALSNYAPPAAMSAELWVAIASWWHLVKHWAEEKTT